MLSKWLSDLKNRCFSKNHRHIPIYILLVKSTAVCTSVYLYLYAYIYIFMNASQSHRSKVEYDNLLCVQMYSDAPTNNFTSQDYLKTLIPESLRW